MAAGAGWPTAVLTIWCSLQGSRVFYLLTFFPSLALYGLSLKPRWFSRGRRAVQVALGLSHLTLVLLCVALVASGRVPLTPGVILPRVLAVLGFIACVRELLRLWPSATATAAELEVTRYLAGERTLTDLTPESRGLLSVRAIELVDTDAARAERVFTDLLALDGDEPFWCVGLARSLSEQGRQAEAFDVLQRGVVTHSTDFALHMTLSSIAVELDQLAVAARAIRRAQALADSDEERKMVVDLKDALRTLRTPVVIALLPGEVTAGFFARRLTAIANSLDAQLVNEDEENATFGAGQTRVQVEPCDAAFADVAPKINWLAWPRGEALSGVSVSLYAATNTEAITLACAVAAALVKDTAGGVITPFASHRAQAATDWCIKVGANGSAAFIGLIDVGPAPEGPSALVLDGLQAWGLPDLIVDMSPWPEPQRWIRGNLVAAWVAHQLVSRGKPWASGEMLEVPIGAEIGNVPLEQLNPSLEHSPHERWLVEANAASLLLRCEAPFTASSASFVSDGGYLPYRLSVKRSLLGDDRTAQCGWLRALPKLPVVAETFVYQWPDGGFLTTTVGFGRWRQPGAGAVPFAEFAVLTPSHSPELARRIAMIGALYSMRGEAEAAWGDWHRVVIGPLELASPEFVALVLYPWKVHAPAPDHRVVHWVPVLVTEAERSVPLDELPQWLTPGKLADYSKRWVRDLPDTV